MNAQNMIKSSMRLLGLIEVGETPPDDELQDALSAFNTMLDGWSAKRHMIYARTEEGFTLTASTGSYSMGTNTTRAIKIEDAFLRDSNDIDTRVKIISKEVYHDIPDKTVQGRPEYLMYDPQHSLSEIHLYPVPDTTYTLYTDSWKPLSTVATLTTTISFPPGYERAFKYNLAIEIAAEYGVQIPPSIALIADRSMRDLVTINAPRLEATIDVPAGVQGGFDINTGDYKY